MQNDNNLQDWLQQLEINFSISGKVSFFITNQGLVFSRIQTAKASALVSIYAGQVLNYRPAGQDQDLLFVSDEADFTPGKAIRGGIPICWPWFGLSTQASNPAHGFVRNHYWSLTAVNETDRGDINMTLTCQNDESSQSLWDHAFNLHLQITIGDSLTLALSTLNTGQDSFKITEALHTYFKVSDIEQVEIFGLEKLNYLDKNQNFVKKYQEGKITLKQPTDHIYPAPQHQYPLVIEDPIYHRQIQINACGHQNVVIWNPWYQGASKLKDLGNFDYRCFVCLEAANVDHSIELEAGDKHTISCQYVISSL